MNRQAKRLVALFLTVAIACTMLVAPGYAAEMKAKITAKRATWNGNKCTVEVVSEGESFEIVSGEYQIHFNKDLLQLESVASGSFSGGIKLLPPAPVAIGNANDNGFLNTTFSDNTLQNTTIANGQVFATYVFVMKDGVEADDADFTISDILFTRQGASEGEDYEEGTFVAGDTLTTHVPGTPPQLQETFEFTYGSEGAVVVNGKNDENDPTIRIPDLTAGSKNENVKPASLSWKVEVAAGKTGNAGDIDFDYDVDAGTVDVVVSKNAVNGEYTITGEYGNKPGAPVDKYSGKTVGTLVVKRADPAAAEVKIFSGNKEITGDKDIIGIPSTGNNTKSYTAQAYDQFGSVFAGAALAQEGSATGSGVSFSNGTVTVAHDAAGDSSVVLKATCGSAPAKTLTVTAKSVEIDWSGISLKSNTITYGTTNAGAFNAMPSGSQKGTAYVDNSTVKLSGTFSVVDGTDVPNATTDGTTHNIYVQFEVTGGEYAGIYRNPDAFQVTVNKKPVAVTWSDISKEYTGTAQKPTASVSGLVSGQTLTPTVTVTAKDAARASGVGIEIGTYTATATTDNTNYTLTNATTDFTITKKSVTISGITAASKVYDGTTALDKTKLSGGTVTGLISESEKVTVDFTGATATFADKRVGSNKTVNITGIKLAGDDAKNYNLSNGTATATAGITAKSVTVARGITVTEKVYDRTTTATLVTTNAEITGKIESDTLTVASATGVFDNANAGDSKTVTISGITLGGADAGNYILASEGNQASAAGKITKKPLAIDDSAFTVTKEYDGKTDPGTEDGELKLTGVIDGDTVTLAAGVTVGAYADAAIGKNKTVTLSGIALEGAQAGNYSIANTYSFTRAEITKTKPIKDTHFTVSIPAASPYDNSAREATVEPKEGVEGLGTATVSYAKQKADGATYEDATTTKPVNAGTYKVIVSFAEGTNYAEMTGRNAIDAGTLTINKADRDLTVTPDSLLLKPGSLSGTVTLDWGESNKDNSAKATYTVSKEGVVNRSDATFTAASNGTVTVTVSAAATDNYNALATSVTVAITSWPNPAEGLTVATSGDDTASDKVSYTISGNTITVSGVMDKDNNTLAFAAAAPAGRTLDTSVEDKLTIKDTASDTELATYTVVDNTTALPNINLGEGTNTSLDLDTGDTAGSVASGIDSSTGVNESLVQDSANKLTGADSAAASSLATEAKTEAEAKKEAIAAAIDSNVTIEVKVGMKIEAVAAENNSTDGKYSYTVDVRPVYTIIATGTKSGSAAKYVLVGTVGEDGTTVTPVDLPNTKLSGAAITVSVKLPTYLSSAVTGSKALFVEHMNGSSVIETLKATVTSGVASWPVTSFSTFRLRVQNDTKTVTFTKGDGTTFTGSYDYRDIGTALPTDTKGTDTFDGWQVNGTGTAYKTVTQEFLDAIAANQTATAKFTPKAPDPVVPTPTPTPTPGGSSGGGSSSSDRDETVDIKSSSRDHGTVRLSSSSPKKGDTVTITVRPDRGYEVERVTVLTSSGKTVDVRDEGGNEYTFTMPGGTVRVDVTYRLIGALTPETFGDVPGNYWAKDAIEWVNEQGYMKGNTAYTFNPEGRITRQQMWMIMARMAGANPADFNEAKAWAINNGISDGTRPGYSVTRQQMVTILYRYAELMGHSTSGGTDLTSFPDSNAVADYAQEALRWSVGNGIVGGTASGTLNPNGTATRAQFATILQRFYTSLE